MRKILAAAFCCLLTISLPAWAENSTETPADNDSVVYVELKPAFVTNYQARKMGYLKADVTLKVKGATAAAIDRHAPYIRHNLVMLFSRQHQDTLNSPEGKLQLKQEAIHEIVAALEAEGEPSQVEDILFTSFIVD